MPGLQSQKLNLTHQPFDLNLVANLKAASRDVFSASVGRNLEMARSFKLLPPGKDLHTLRLIFSESKSILIFGYQGFSNAAQ